MVPEGQPAPKRGDFIHWTELLADTVARGPSVRGYLKALSRCRSYSLVVDDMPAT